MGEKSTSMTTSSANTGNPGTDPLRSAGKPEKGRRFTVRPYQSSDREAIRRLCCETGFLGKPVDPIFEDRELFADFLTAYYTDCEPESSLVAESSDGRIVGYLIACCRPDLYRRVHPRIIARAGAKAVWRLITGRYSKNTRKYLYWLVWRGWRETPEVPSKSAAHFHFNLLPDWRHWRVTLELLGKFKEDLQRRGVRDVYGQMVIPPGRRPERVFERFGWTFYDTRRLTKFDEYVEGEFLQATIRTTIDE